jgi:hypothetical protein
MADNPYASVTIKDLEMLRRGEVNSRAAARLVKDRATRAELVRNHTRIIRKIEAELRRRRR